MNDIWQMRRDACDQNVATVEEEALALGNVDDLHARKNALNDQIKGHKNKLGQFRVSFLSVFCR